MLDFCSSLHSVHKSWDFLLDHFGKERHVQCKNKHDPLELHLGIWKTLSVETLTDSDGSGGFRRRNVDDLGFHQAFDSPPAFVELDCEVPDQYCRFVSKFSEGKEHFWIRPLFLFQTQPWTVVWCRSRILRSLAWCRPGA